MQCMWCKVVRKECKDLLALQFERYIHYWEPGKYKAEPEVKAEPNPVAKAEANAEVKAEPETKAKNESKPETKAKPKGKAKK